MQKCLCTLLNHTIVFYKYFTIKFLFPMNFVITFGICSTPKLSKHVTFLTLTYKGRQWVPIDSY